VKPLHIAITAAIIIIATIFILSILIPAAFAFTPAPSPTLTPTHNTFHGQYITIDHTTYNKTNSFDYDNPKKPVKHFELYTILQDIDNTLSQIVLSLNLQIRVIQTSLANMHADVITLQTISTSHDSSIQYLMNHTSAHPAPLTPQVEDDYDSIAIKSLMRDSYKIQWFDIFNEWVNWHRTIFTTDLTLDDKESMLSGNATMHDYTNIFYNLNLIQINNTQTAYDNFFIANPTYDPSIEDLTTNTRPSSPDDPDWLNWEYREILSKRDSTIQYDIDLLIFNATIPENLFVKGIGMHDAPWRP